MLSSLGLNYIDAHFAKLHQDVFDLLGLDPFHELQGAYLVFSDIATLLGVADQLRDGNVDKVEQRAIGRFFVPCRHRDFACHLTFSAVEYTTIS